MLVSCSEKSKKKTYLSISHGRVVKGTGNDKKRYYCVDGSLRGIYKKDSSFNGERVTRWYIDLEDEQELFCLCLPYSSGVFKSIILALASEEQLSRSTALRIEPYEKNGYTKVVVYANGVKLDWVSKLPEQETIQAGGKEVKDDSKQMAFITSLVDKITERINNK